MELQGEGMQSERKAAGSLHKENAKAMMSRGCKKHNQCLMRAAGFNKRKANCPAQSEKARDDHPQASSFVSGSRLPRKAQQSAARSYPFQQL
jgi:hypothetical protein